MTIPINITTQTLTPAMAMNPGRPSVFRVLINVLMGTLETNGDAPMDIIFCIDKSGSTGQVAQIESGASILDVEKEALMNIVNNVTNPDTRIGVVSFDDRCFLTDCLPLTQCDPAGKMMLNSFISVISVRNRTDYSSGLNEVVKMLPAPDPGRKRIVIFTSDGDNIDGDNAEAIRTCQNLRDMGVTVYVAGICVEDKFKDTLDAMSPGMFRDADNADEIGQFFADAQQQSASAIVTNGTLTVKVPKFVEEINEFGLALRGGNLDFIPGEVDPNNARMATVKFNDLGSDELSFYLALRVKQPDDVEASKPYSYGLVTLDGQVASQNMQGQLAKTNIVVQYGDADTIMKLKERMGQSFANADVNAVISAYAVAKELKSASDSGDAAAAAQAVDNARKTIAFMPKDRQFGLDKTVEVVAAKIDENDLAGMKTAVRGGTTAFAKPKDRAAAFNKK